MPARAKAGVDGVEARTPPASMAASGRWSGRRGRAPPRRRGRTPCRGTRSDGRLRSGSRPLAPRAVRPAPSWSSRSFCALTSASNWRRCASRDDGSASAAAPAGLGMRTGRIVQGRFGPEGGQVRDGGTAAPEPTRRLRREVGCTQTSTLPATRASVQSVSRHSKLQASLNIQQETETIGERARRATARFDALVRAVLHSRSRAGGNVVNQLHQQNEKLEKADDTAKRIVEESRAADGV